MPLPSVHAQPERSLSLEESACHHNHAPARVCVCNGAAMQLRLIQRQAAGHSGATRPEAPCSARAEDSPVERRGWQRRDLGPADLPAVVVFVVAVQLRAASRSRCAGLGHLLRSAIVATTASSANGREETHSAPWKRAAKGGDRAGLTPWKPSERQRQSSLTPWKRSERRRQSTRSAFSRPAEEPHVLLSPAVRRLGLAQPAHQRLPPGDQPVSA